MLDFIIGPLRALHDRWTLWRLAVKKDKALVGLELKEPFFRSVFAMVPIGPDPEPIFDEDGNDITPEKPRVCVRILVSDRDDWSIDRIFGSLRRAATRGQRMLH